MRAAYERGQEPEDDAGQNSQQREDAREAALTLPSPKAHPHTLYMSPEKGLSAWATGAFVLLRRVGPGSNRVLEQEYGQGLGCIWFPPTSVHIGVPFPSRSPIARPTRRNASF